MSVVKPKTLIKNPHLEGGPFFWKAGAIGVLLIHGFTATTAEIRPLAKELHAHGYTVAGPVLPGHNTQPDEINKFTWRDWLEEVNSAYTNLAAQCDQVFVGGESTGGLLALNLAAQTPDISGILAFAPALKLNIGAFNRIFIKLLAPIVPYIPKKHEDDGLPWKGYTVTPLKGVVQLLALQQHVRPLLHKIHQPLLIVQGRLDQTVDSSVPQMIAHQVRSSDIDIHWMEHSNHCVVLDCEIEQVKIISLRFLTKYNN